MIVTVESKAKPCPGVERAIALAEEVLGRGEVLYSVGQLIHNRREIERLTGMGLLQIKHGELAELCRKEEFDEAHFLSRTHGESEELLNKVRECGFKIVDATCTIVRHSQDLVDEHVRKGYGIVIAGNKSHPEVMGLLTRTRGCGIVVSSREEAENQDLDNRSVLLAQTTIDPVLFSEVRRVLSAKLSNLRIVDTTCRFLRKRQSEVAAFSSQFDVVLVVGGNKSANCQLLHNVALEVNERSYKVEGLEDVNEKWFDPDDRVGILGGASTPRWQLEEMKSYLNNHRMQKNPKGLKDRKGGKFLWWTRKNMNSTE
jgi:(E)-4-hydroxy-3-methyl-but-2-enyl pyrophosphate reductase